VDRGIPADRCVVDRQIPPVVLDTSARPHSGSTRSEVRGIPEDRCVVDRQIPLVPDASAPRRRAIPTQGAVADRRRAIVFDSAAESCTEDSTYGIASDGALVDCQYACEISIPAPCPRTYSPIGYSR
jgi:hypothetical protein